MSEITLSAEWLADVRLRAEQQMEQCLHEHTVHKTDDPTRVWITCDDPVEERMLGTLQLRPSSTDASDEIRAFIERTLGNHNRDVSSTVILTLLAAVGA